MQSSQIAWLVLFLFALMMIVIGIQGSLGILFGILFCPQYIIISSDTVGTGGEK